MFQGIDITAFPPEREKSLKSIYRFSMFERLLYRSNLWMHTHRVLWLVEEIMPLAQKHLVIDTEKARALALIHDDAEIITGDVQAGHKARMSKEELSKIERSEEKAIEKLTKKFPEYFHGYAYKSLLLHALRKDCLEAQLVSYLDKVDAQCESLHEVLAGNISLLRSVMFYVNVLTLFPQKFPKLIPLLQCKESPLTHFMDSAFPKEAKIERYARLNEPHSLESLHVQTDFPFYNAWRKIVMDKGGKEGTKWLLEQKESL